MSIHDVVSFDDEPLILVDDQDEIVGYDTKANVHLGAGILHRAFSIFVLSGGGRVLLQQRSREKPLWPLYWSNSCCSHPRRGESCLDAAHRRLREELALEAELTYAYQFQYRAEFRGVGTEHELCSVYIGRLADEPAVEVNASEVAAWRWATPEEVDDLLVVQPERLTPWFKLEWATLRREYPQLLAGLD